MERPIVGACRELLEETGIQTNHEQLSLKCQLKTTHSCHISHDFIYEYQHSGGDAPQPTIDNKEIISAHFFNLADIKTMLLDENAIKYLIKKGVHT